MADNVAITAGSGTTIATDDISTVHYQRVKLVDGTLDSTVAIPGNSSGLSTTRDVVTWAAQTPTIDTAVYADADRLGSVVTLSNAGARNGGSGMFFRAVMIDDAASNFSIEAHFFQVSPTMANADNGAFDLTDANIATAVWLGAIDFWSANSKVFTSNRVTQGTYLGGPPWLGYTCDASATSLYMILRARGAYDAAATDDLVLHLAAVRF